MKAKKCHSQKKLYNMYKYSHCTILFIEYNKIKNTIRNQIKYETNNIYIFSNYIKNDNWKSINRLYYNNKYIIQDI